MDTTNLDFILAGLNQLDSGFALYDGAKILVSCNRRYAELRDLPPEFCRPGASFRAMLDFSAARGDYGEEPDAEVERRLAAFGDAEAIQLDQATRSGLILRIHVRPVPDGGMLVSYTDITDLRQAEDRLRESETRHALVTEASTEGLYDWNVVDDILYVSPRLNEIFGFEEGQLRSKEWVSRIHPDDQSGYRDAMVEHFKGGAARQEAAYRITAHDGAIRWVHDNAIAVRDETGKAIRLVGAITDVTPQKRAEEALLESEERHILALDAVGEWVFDWDAVNDDVYYSDGMYKSLNLARDQLRTAKDWQDRILPEDLEEYKRCFVRLLKGEADHFGVEYRFMGTDGEVHWASTHGTAVRDDDGRVLRVVGSTGDITERMNMTADLEGARQRLVEADKLAMLGQLTAGIAHEIKNPLNFVNIFRGLTQITTIVLA